MFREYVYINSPAAYTNHIWVNDVDHISQNVTYIDAFAIHGFNVIEYEDDISFRIEYEKKREEGNEKIAVLNSGKEYVPYDILRNFTIYTVSLRNLFPKLNSEVLRHKSKIDFDLLTLVLKKNYDNLMNPEKTQKFFDTVVYSKDNLTAYFTEEVKHVLQEIQNATSYSDWYRIAEEKADIDRYSVQYGLNIDTCEINVLFQNYVLQSFGKLSSKVDYNTPVLVSHTMDYIHEQSEKFAIIVMDGMSEFDWNIISESFIGIQYEKSAMFAMIPSTTSISRQCLLSNKFPSQLIAPWIQSKEKAEFIECAKSMGYAENQIAYLRGYDVEFDSCIRCGTVIINDVDDMVHAQLQGRIGMYNDVSLLSNKGKLRKLTERLMADGFDVYITSDHGNTVCTGIGRFVGAGVDVETKSHRMLVLKDFADKTKMKDKFGLIEYPKYYLNKEYDYLICNTDKSLDDFGKQVMTHGGMTIDEVVVPFIKIKAVQNNG